MSSCHRHGHFIEDQFVSCTVNSFIQILQPPSYLSHPFDFGTLPFIVCIVTSSLELGGRSSVLPPPPLCSFADPTPLTHADTSRDVLPRGGTSQLFFLSANLAEHKRTRIREDRPCG
ncbi:hypothetical protein TNCV_2003481 [Trichonephila clavipes]|nr:hypothetical protein TNCV_2003481 [Trichonephila clavipes]